MISEVPQDLWEKFEEFPPIFINQSVGAEDIPQHVKDYLAKSGRVATPDQKKLLGVLKAQKVLLYAHLLKCYHEHGLKITAVHRTIDYIPRKIFSWFVQQVANMRRKGDVEEEEALLAEVYKLLGYSAYGKFIEAVECQTKVLHTKDEDVVDKHLRLVCFEDLDRQDYELIQMDTDSMYFALSYDTLEEAVKPELLKEFEREKKQWPSVEQQRARLVQT